jgi:hypothetical protein
MRAKGLNYLEVEKANAVKAKNLITILACVGLLLAGGCGKKGDTASDSSNKVRVGYIGLTCEAPILTAV